MEKKKILEKVLQIILSSPFFWSAITIAVTWILTHLADIPWWQVWLALIFVIGCTFWIVNQVKLWRGSRFKDFSRKSDKEIVEILREWFDKRHYSSSTLSDEKYLFHIVGTDKENRNINVIRSKENPSTINIFLSINEQDISKIPQPYQNKARFDINIEMARVGLLCNPSPQMYIEQVLYCDEFLTESKFWNAVDRIRQGHVLINANLKLASLEAEMVKQEPSGDKQVDNEKKK
jgi:hypothetical protein